MINKKTCNMLLQN